VNADALLMALDLPAASRVDQRVPKKLLLENGAPTPADKHHINEGIEELLWLAALKPTTIGVPAYCDEAREYLEISVLRLTLRSGAKTTRLMELVHRAIPYPVLLLTDQGAQSELSAAHKRWSQGETGKTVLEGDVIAFHWDSGRDADCWLAFRYALALDRQSHATLYALYQGWIDTLLALQAAQVTGTFAIAATVEHAVARRDALRECACLGAEIARLRTAATKEKQMARQVELNLELKRVAAHMAAAKEKL
jgi:hypothetical protein